MAPSSAYTKATASQDLSTYTSRTLQLPLEFQGPQRARVHPPAWAQYTAPGLGTGGQGSHLPKKESLWKWHLDKRVKKQSKQTSGRSGKSVLLAHIYPWSSSEKRKWETDMGQSLRSLPIFPKLQNLPIPRYSLCWQQSLIHFLGGMRWSYWDCSKGEKKAVLLI